MPDTQADLTERARAYRSGREIVNALAGLTGEEGEIVCQEDALIAEIDFALQSEREAERAAILDALHKRLPYPTEACAIIRGLPPRIIITPTEATLTAAYENLRNALSAAVSEEAKVIQERDILTEQRDRAMAVIEAARRWRKEEWGAASSKEIRHSRRHTADELDESDASMALIDALDAEATAKETGYDAAERDDWLWSDHGPTPALDESDSPHAGCDDAPAACKT